MRERDQRGQALSVFMAVGVVALLLVCGLVVDGGAQARAVRQAETAAALAARAAVDATAPARLAGAAPEPAVAIRAAEQVLDGYPDLTGEVRLVAGRVEVATRARVETVFLSLIGISTLAASGSATAELQEG